MAQKRRIRRAAVAVLATLVLTVGVAFAMFWYWRSEHVRTLEAGSRIMHTGLGDVEYAVAGTGTPYLYLHGTPGGYDATLAGRRAMPKPPDDVMTIAVSRPGYLRTPLASSRTFEEQADLFAAVLDELHVQRAVIIANSGGGYVGLQFALRHPGRCLGLVLIAPSVSYEPLPGDSANSLLLTLRDFGIWAAVSSSTIRNILANSMMRDWNAKDAEQIAFLDGILRSIVPMGRRFDGVLNDQQQRTDSAIDQWPLDRITVPTLIVHGTADENSDYQGSVRVTSRIPGAKLVTLPGADHFFPLTHAPELRGYIRQFVDAQRSTGTDGR